MFPDRTGEIQFFRENAYKFWKGKNYDLARSSFSRWVESLKQQNINSNGGLEKELEAARKEYSEFVKNDPLYIKFCDTIFPAIKSEPNILQTDLYKLFPQLSKDYMSYALYFAAEHGKVKRIKKGRTYCLSIKTAV